jgi:hypothetical protein
MSRATAAQSVAVNMAQTGNNNGTRTALGGRSVNTMMPSASNAYANAAKLIAMDRSRSATPTAGRARGGPQQQVQGQAVDSYNRRAAKFHTLTASTPAVAAVSRDQTVFEYQ